MGHYTGNRTLKEFYEKNIADRFKPTQNQIKSPIQVTVMKHLPLLKMCIAQELSAKVNIAQNCCSTVSPYETPKSFKKIHGNKRKIAWSYFQLAQINTV